jgi:hypothetical protein
MSIKKFLDFHGKQSPLPGLHQSSDHIDELVLHSVYSYETILIISCHI